MISIINLKNLKPHEYTSSARSNTLLKKLLKSGKLYKPIVVDKKSKTILDGHHRCRLLKELGYKKVPAMLVDYYSRSIQIKPRRKNIPVSKHKVLKRAKDKNPFPYKTTRHIWKEKLPKINIKFKELI